MAWKTGWTRRRKITILASQVVGSGSHSNFPVAIQITASWDPIFTKPQTDGDDICFTSSDGTTALAYDRSIYDRTNKFFLAFVKVTSISGTTDTDIYMYYGNASASDQQDVATTWADYHLVWHLNETSGNVVEETGNLSFNSQSLEAQGVSITGPVGKAARFNGTTSVIHFDGSYSVNKNDQIYVEAIFKSDGDTGGAQQIQDWRAGSSPWSRHYTRIYPWSTNQTFHGRTEPDASETDDVNKTGETATNWNHLFHYYDGNIGSQTHGIRANKVNGNVNTSLGFTFNYGFYNFWIGDNYASGAPFDGLIAELRVHKVTRSNDWMDTSYNNLMSNSSFFTLGAEEREGPRAIEAKILNFSNMNYMGGALRNSIQADWSVQAILSQLCEEFTPQALRNSFQADWGVQAIQRPLGESLWQFIRAPQGYQFEQAIINGLRDSITAVQSLINEFSDSAAAVQAIINQIMEKDVAQGVQAVGLGIGEVAFLYPPTATVTIDGIPMTEKVSRFVIRFSQRQVHNECTVEVADMTMFSQFDPSVGSGTERIKIKFNSRELLFFIEDRSANEGQGTFSLWGRTKTALADAPFDKGMSYSLAAPERASVVAAALAGSVSLEWDTIDWVLPTTFNFTGTGLAGIQKLAKAVGAVVRTKDDGSLKVRNKYPVRPVDLGAASSVADFDRVLDIVSLDSRYDPEQGYNTILVNGYSGEFEASFDLELEDGCKEIGDDVFVRAYGVVTVSGVDPVVSVTDGSAIYLGTYSETITERVSFIEGRGAVAKRIKDLQSIAWLGDNLGSPTWTKDEKELILSTIDCGVADVTYIAEYRRYRVFGHSVEELIFCMSSSLGDQVAVRVDISPGDNEADAIDEEILTTKAAAVTRGRAELDDSYYTKKRRRIRVPYAEVRDGEVIGIASDRMDVGGKHHVTSVEIVGTEAGGAFQVMILVEAEQYATVG